MNAPYGKPEQACGNCAWFKRIEKRTLTEGFCVCPLPDAVQGSVGLFRRTMLAGAGAQCQVWRGAFRKQRSTAKVRALEAENAALKLKLRAIAQEKP